MKAYHIYFIVLKLLIILQIILVFCKKMTQDQDLYVITDTVFKVSVGLYLFIFFNIYSFPGLEFEDTVILRFSGTILLFDIDFTNLLRIIRRYIPSFPKVPFIENEKPVNKKSSTF